MKTSARVENPVLFPFNDGMVLVGSTPSV